LNLNQTNLKDLKPNLVKKQSNIEPEACILVKLWTIHYIRTTLQPILGPEQQLLISVQLCLSIQAHSLLRPLVVDL